MVRTSPNFEITSFTLLSSEGDNHHIAQYDESPEYFVRRRGEIFQASIKLPEKRKNANYEISLVLKDPSNQERIMKVSSQASSDNTQTNPEDGSTQSFCAPSSQCSDDENTLLVDIYLSPVSTPIGAYTLAARVREEGQEEASDSRKGEIDCEKPVLILFNPWCSDDDCFLDDENERVEYVLNEEGFVYQGGSGGSVSPKAWSYDQFDGDVIKTIVYLISKVPKEKRSSPVLVSRLFSAFINSADDDGILTGNWSGDYAGGTAPYVWNGSQPIFKQFLDSNFKEVQFGQCWVFAGVLTTAMRAIGVPCRPVTNYGSAHDANANRTVEYFYKGRSKLDASDSVWNFHVWNDVWMKRRDLDENGMYDGWQAIDATPQEESDSAYQMGPASLVAVQQGKRVNYDTDFVLAEVNADIIHYQEMPNGKFQMSRVDTKSVGKMVITKSVGADDYIDVVSNYKAAEGSASERATMLRKAGEPSLGVDLELSYGENRPELGKEVKITLVGKKAANEDFTLHGDAIFFSRAYHGRTRTEIKKVDLTGLKAPFQMELTMAPEEYCKFLQSEAGFWFHLEVNLMEDQKSQIFAEELDFELESSYCIKTSFAGQATKGQTVELPFTITNPFSDITLTGGKASLEGSKRLLGGKKLLVDVPDLGPGKSADVKVPFTPLFPGGFNVTIDVDFNEACDISTFTKVQVA